MRHRGPLHCGVPRRVRCAATPSAHDPGKYVPHGFFTDHLLTGGGRRAFPPHESARTARAGAPTGRDGRRRRYRRRVGPRHLAGPRAAPSRPVRTGPRARRRPVSLPVRIHFRLAPVGGGRARPRIAGPHPAPRLLRTAFRADSGQRSRFRRSSRAAVRRALRTERRHRRVPFRRRHASGRCLRLRNPVRGRQRPDVDHPHPPRIRHRRHHRRGDDGLLEHTAGGRHGVARTEPHRLRWRAAGHPRHPRPDRGGDRVVGAPSHTLRSRRCPPPTA